jgi:hypothetical protein
MNLVKRIRGLWRFDGDTEPVTVSRRSFLFMGGVVAAGMVVPCIDVPAPARALRIPTRYHLHPAQQKAMLALQQAELNFYYVMGRCGKTSHALAYLAIPLRKGGQR